MRRAGARWQRRLDEHQRAIASFLEAARALPAEAWQRPRASGKWSPGEVAQHLVLTYEAMLRELAGGPGVGIRVHGVRQRLLRWFVLPHILFHRSFPVRAAAPREIRPAGELPDRDLTLERLERIGREFELALTRARSRGAGQLSHPYFGRLSAVRSLRFATVHVEHHQRQLQPSTLHPA